MDAEELNTTHVERLVEMEQKMRYLQEVPDSIRFLTERFIEVAERAQGIDALEARIDALPVKDLYEKVETLEYRQTKIENLEKGDSSTSPSANLERQVEEIDNSQKTLIQVVHDLTEDLKMTIEAVRAEIAEVNSRVNLTMRAVANQTQNQNNMGYSRLKIPEPKAFGGNRDAKELENFLFDIEQYFKATDTVSEESKVTIATMHLADDAKLWWRMKINESGNGMNAITTWEDLKKELRAQFFPENVEIIARRKLRELTHAGTIREYVKQFSSLMLDIQDMSEKDKVFYFVEGLQPWARTKIYEQRVQDVATAMSAAERLMDIRGESSPSKRTSPQRSYQPQAQRFSSPDKKNLSPQRSDGPWRNNDKKTPSPKRDDGSWRAPHPPNNNYRSNPTCILCKGQHHFSNCPHRASLSALQVQIQYGSCSKVGTENKKEEAEDENPRIGALKFLSAIQKKGGSDNKGLKRGLMYVDAKINLKTAKSTMVDSGATHNFISDQEARRLGLKVEKDPGRVKAVNSDALPIVGVAKQIPLAIGTWTGDVDLVVARIDDFDIVLGMEFLLKHQVIPVPLAKCLIIADDNPTVVDIDIKQPGNMKMIAALQLKKGLQCEEPTPMTTLVVHKETTEEEIPLGIQEVPSEYFDIKVKKASRCEPLPVPSGPSKSPQALDLAKKWIVLTKYSRLIQEYLAKSKDPPRSQDELGEKSKR